MELCRFERVPCYINILAKSNLAVVKQDQLSFQTNTP